MRKFSLRVDSSPNPPYVPPRQFLEILGA